MDTPIAKFIVIALVVLFLATLVAVAAGLFNTSRGDANDNQVALQSQLGDLKMAKFNDFDQKLVSGTHVTGAYNSLKSENIALVVKTCQGTWINYNAVISPFSTSNSATAIPFDGLSLNAVSKQIASSVSYINASSSSTNISLVLDGTGDQTIVRKNSTTTNMYKNGAKDYVSPTATFQSYLILDSGDQIIGVVFIQEGKHV